MSAVTQTMAPSCWAASTPPSGSTAATGASPNQPPPMASAARITSGSHMLTPEWSCGSVRISPKKAMKIIRAV